MTSVWTEADRAAREAIESELKRRMSLTPERLREVQSLIGHAVSVKALSFLGGNREKLGDVVREMIPA